MNVDGGPRGGRGAGGLRAPPSVLRGPSAPRGPVGGPRTPPRRSCATINSFSRANTNRLCWRVRARGAASRWTIVTLVFFFFDFWNFFFNACVIWIWFYYELYMNTFFLFFKNHFFYKNLYNQTKWSILKKYKLYSIICDFDLSLFYLIHSK